MISNLITFHVSEKIRDIGDSPTSKIPHFRKGHFRRLQSDYFANKKRTNCFRSRNNGKRKGENSLNVRGHERICE